MLFAGLDIGHQDRHLTRNVEDRQHLELGLYHQYAAITALIGLARRSMQRRTIPTADVRDVERTKFFLNALINFSGKTWTT